MLCSIKMFHFKLDWRASKAVNIMAINTVKCMAFPINTKSWREFMCTWEGYNYFFASVRIYSRISFANAHEFILSSTITDFQYRHFLETLPKLNIISSTYLQSEVFGEDFVRSFIIIIKRIGLQFCSLYNSSSDDREAIVKQLTQTSQLVKLHFLTCGC
jgi:hypothetical protein